MFIPMNDSMIVCAVMFIAVLAQGAEKWPETPPPTGRSVTWERLNKLDPGLKEIGRLAVCEAKDLKAASGRFDGEYLTVGLTDICDTPYPEMVKAFRESGSRMYETRYGKQGIMGHRSATKEKE